VRSQTLAVAARLAAALLLAPASGSAQAVDSAGPPGSELEIYLMTMGQGDQIWERYGHNAIGIRNRLTGADIVFNWGLFSFDEPGFIGKFLHGDMLYWMGGQDAASTLASYRSLNRTVEIQELNLSPPQRLNLLAFIQNNAREENKFYRYDYFLDNCSTRVRDALNGVLGGALRMATDSVETATSYRWHALRLMAEDRLAVVGIDIALGRPTDRRISQWEEMFIPMKVRDRVRELQVPDDSGRLVPLVMSERVLFQATRTPERDTPPLLILPLGVLGLLIGGALYFAFRRQRAAFPLAVGVAVVLGILSIALAYLRFMTQHVAAYANTNLLVYNPLWVVILVGLPVIGSMLRVRRFVFFLATATTVLTALGIVAPFLPGLRQGSFAVIALAAPAGLMAAWIIRERTRPATTPAG
jgi:hypothetical protein